MRRRPKITDIGYSRILWKRLWKKISRRLKIKYIYKLWNIAIILANFIQGYSTYSKRCVWIREAYRLCFAIHDFDWYNQQKNSYPTILDTQEKELTEVINRLTDTDPTSRGELGSLEENFESAFCNPLTEIIDFLDTIQLKDDNEKNRFFE